MNPPAPGLRILELTQRYPPALGGVERHVEQLVEGLRTSGATVEVATSDLRTERPFARVGPRGPDADGIRRHRAWPLVPGPHGLGILAPGMFPDALRATVDVLHAHAFGYFPTWAGAMSARLRALPFVVTTHSDASPRTWLSRPYGWAVAWATLRSADRVIALTRREATLLAARGVDPARITVIPNGIDLTEFPNSPHRDAHDGLRLVYVGRIYPQQKGLDVLIEALARIPASHGVSLRLVGEDWAGRASLEQAARRLGVADRVVFTGPLPRASVLGEFDQADALVLPSRFEPFGIVLLEAMAAGLPIIASRVGGIPEVVEEGRTALLVPPEDPAALAGAIERLWAEQPLRDRFSASGRDRVRAFGWPVLIPRFLELFRDVAESGR